MSGTTRVGIESDRFTINGEPTYSGQWYDDARVEGLLLNSRMVQATFDDDNSETRARWAYPDTGVWDPDRNTREFLEAMPVYRRHGLLAVTLNLQGGSPEGYSDQQPWRNSAFAADGTLRDDYRRRFELVLDEADRLGMVIILGLFYFGQDEHLQDESAVRRAVDEAVGWLLERGDRHVLIEVNNECDVPRYEHDILTPARVPELIEQVRRSSEGRLLVGTSFKGGSIPTLEVQRSSDFLLLHGNFVDDPAHIGEMVREVRRSPAYRPMPIVFNEDDHFDFDEPKNNMLEAIRSGASWGYFDPGRNDYEHGFQSPPVRWDLNTDRKQAFFGTVTRLAGVEDDV
jgi:hypothetical protein